MITIVGMTILPSGWVVLKRAVKEIVYRKTSLKRPFQEYAPWCVVSESMLAWILKPAPRTKSQKARSSPFQAPLLR